MRLCNVLNYTNVFESVMQPVSVALLWSLTTKQPRSAGQFFAVERDEYYLIDPYGR